MDCWITAVWPRDFTGGRRNDMTLRFGTGLLSSGILPEHRTTSMAVQCSKHRGMISVMNKLVDRKKD